MKWTRTKGADGRYEYTSGPYRIARCRFGWDFHHDGERYPPRWTAVYFTLPEAKLAAEKHANKYAESYK